MPRNVYSELHIHVVWHTKSNDPCITAAIEDRLHHYLHHRAVQFRGVFVHADNGTPDHVHIAVSIPPTLLISDWIGDLKGASAHHMNHAVTRPGSVDWQTGYGVVSFGTGDIPWVVRYIRNQKEHHRTGRVFERLERILSDAPEGSGPGKPVNGLQSAGDEHR